MQCMPKRWLILDNRAGSHKKPNLHIGFKAVLYRDVSLLDFSDVILLHFKGRIQRNIV
jgi:hypothetical protein